MEMLKKIGKSFVIGTIMGIVIAFTTNNFAPDLIDQLENQSYYLRYYWKYLELKTNNGNNSDDEDETGIYIIDIDDRSQQKMGMYWNWNRSYHARMINTLNQHFPAAIVFDINFFDPEDKNHKKRIGKLLRRSHSIDPDNTLSEKAQNSILSSIDYDKQLIDATKASGLVYHGLRMSSDEDYPDVHLSQIKNRKMMSWHDSLNPQSCIEVPSKDKHYISSEKNIVDGIFPGIARYAKAIGHLNMDPNDDGVIRQVPLLYSFGKNKPVYLPMSIRTAATLFGTPNEEIIFKPKQYLDIGKPFKIFKKKDSSIHFSYPNVSVLQIKAILERSEDILALKPNEKLTVTSLLKIGRDSSGAEFISSYSGDLPQPVVYAFLENRNKNFIDMKPGTTISLNRETQIIRDSDVEWILTAPYGDEEWYLTAEDLKMILRLSFKDFESIGIGQTILAFHNFSVKNKNGKLLTDIPVLRDKTLKELCRLKWEEIEEMHPGMRWDLGENVRIPLTSDN